MDELFGDVNSEHFQLRGRVVTELQLVISVWELLNVVFLITGKYLGVVFRPILNRFDFKMVENLVKKHRPREWNIFLLLMCLLHNLKTFFNEMLIIKYIQTHHRPEETRYHHQMVLWYINLEMFQHPSYLFFLPFNLFHHFLIVSN